ncbi:MAG: L-seryl-tRNA(Sec) selenium transferase, partial [Firmicutes bacterium]|nr:L-seryl-tRNA(Sec) selenium transferase [Bacillota bacterium]
MPSVDQVTRAVLGEGGHGPPRAAVVAAARSALAELRLALAQDRLSDLGRGELLALAAAGTRRLLAGAGRPSLGRVVNATGVVLHTNLGRARLAPEAVRAVVVASGPTNLELSLTDGTRLSRQDHTRSLLTALTGAEDALVVNNNAAAVWLLARGVARGRAVVISRGEMVEIGDSFRLPEILAEAGVRLVEVGTTNRTTLEDYRRALVAVDGAAVILVHPSNYRVVGFASRPPRRSVVALAREHGAAVVEDLGSGALLDLGSFGLPGEPYPRQALADGVDAVTFSGDKLLGGPQCGLIAGRGDIVAALRHDPVLRCLRPDKLTLAALEATLRLYTLGPEEAVRRVPVLRALTEPPVAVRRRAARALRLLRRELSAAKERAGLALN